jgi:hypothetical protein
MPRIARELQARHGHLREQLMVDQHDHLEGAWGTGTSVSREVELAEGDLQACGEEVDKDLGVTFGRMAA